MAISATLITPEGTRYDVELEPDWRIHLADGRIVLAEDLEAGNRLRREEDGTGGDLIVKVMGE